MRPNYLVIGTAKAATTTLCALLGRHPQVFMAPAKELEFFSDDRIYSRGVAWYESQFDAPECKLFRGEGSPQYTLRTIHPEASRRIAEYSSALKLIYIVRHPIRRIEAAWLHMRSWVDERAHHSFNKALEANRGWLVDSANYWREIAPYRRSFPDDQILVLFFEDFKADPAATMRRCFEFLGADPDALPDTSLHLNRTAEKHVPVAALSIARSLVGYRTLRRAIPSTWRRSLKGRFLLRRAEGKPRWLPAARQRVLDLLGDDTAQFLRFYGKPVGFWDLEE